jgi:hypothetical protein
MFFIVNLLVFAIELPHLKKKEGDAEGRNDRDVGDRT